MEYWPSAPPDPPSEQGNIARTAVARIKLSKPSESQLNVCLGRFRAPLGRPCRGYYWPGIFKQPASTIDGQVMWPGGPARDLCVATIYKAFQQATSYKPRSTRRHLQATSYTTTTPCYNLQATSHYTVASVTTFATRLFALCRSLHNKMSS